MKVITVVGARPQFVKAAVISRAFKKAGVEEKIIHTGQHFDHGMSDVFFDEMEIPKPHFNLGINSMGHGGMTGAMLAGIEEILLIEKPDAVLVYGDTNSTLAGALAAKKIHIPIAHIEAGLRSFNMDMPEEVNRILTDRISTILYAPTQTAVDNLAKEGYANFNTVIENAGDVMQDAAYFYAEKASSENGILENLQHKQFVLCTLHRAENTDDANRLKNLVDGLNELHKTIPVVLPLHPRTAKIIAASGLITEFTIIEPVGYFDMIRLLEACSLVITDSGGLQKEAFFFKKNCVTMRNQTEWVELVEHGYNVLVGANKQALLAEAKNMLYKTNDFSKNLYGRGDAGNKIVTHLLNWFNNK